MKKHSYLFTGSAFLIILFCFLMPFVSLQCYDNTRLYKTSGINLAFEFERPSLLPDSVKLWRPELTIAFAAALAGAVLAFWKRGAGRFNYVSGALSMVSAGGLLYFYYYISTLTARNSGEISIANLAKMAFDITLEPAFWICLCVSGLLVIFHITLLSMQADSPHLPAVTGTTGQSTE